MVKGTVVVAAAGATELSTSTEKPYTPGEVTLPATELPLLRSKRTEVTPPGACAVAAACSVPVVKEPEAGAATVTSAMLTGLQVSVLASQRWAESQGGLQTWPTQMLLTQLWFVPQAGVQPPPTHAPCWQLEPEAQDGEQPATTQTGPAV